MGAGRWDDKVYNSVNAFHVSTAKSTGRSVTDVKFAYSSGMHATPVDKWKVDPSVDPRTVCGPTSACAGKTIRESRDSDEHPETVPVAVIFDVTGSMNTQPVIFQEKLPKLMTMLVTKAGIEHPNVLFGAFDDINCFPDGSMKEPVWFQVGQFESDNKCDDQLRSLILVGQGGGQTMESYDLAMYWAARHTALDSLEKRGKKGYLFTLGDESYYPAVRASDVKRTFGDSIEKDIPIEKIAAEVREKFEWFHVYVQEGGYKNRHETMDPWRKLMGERMLILDDSTKVCELISSTIAVLEGANFADVVDDPAVGRALAKITPGAVAKTGKGSLPAPTGHGSSRRV